MSHHLLPKVTEVFEDAFENALIGDPFHWDLTPMLNNIHDPASGQTLMQIVYVLTVLTTNPLLGRIPLGGIRVINDPIKALSRDFVDPIVREIVDDVRDQLSKAISMQAS